MNGVGKAIGTREARIWRVPDSAISIHDNVAILGAGANRYGGRVDGAIAIRVAIDDINGDRGVLIGAGAVIIGKWVVIDRVDGDINRCDFTIDGIREAVRAKEVRIWGVGHGVIRFDNHRTVGRITDGTHR